MSAAMPVPKAAEVATLQPARASLDHIVFWSLTGLLLFAPLAFGATEPWSTFVLEAGAALIFAVWAFAQIRSGELRLEGNPLFAPMGTFGVLVVVQWIARLTAYRHDTWSSLLLYTTYALLCFLVVQCLQRTWQVKLLAVTVCVYGFAVALFAIVQGMSSNGKLYWLRAPSRGGWIYGPYVNHNHYAGLMELILPVPMVIALSHFVRGPKKTMAMTAAAVMLASVFLSGSRGGMIAVVVQVAFLFVAVARHENRKGRKTRASSWVAYAAALIATVGLVAWLGGTQLAERLESIHAETRSELSGGTRLAIDRDALRMFARRPVLGWGLGTFPTVYPQFQSFYSEFLVNAAHNDYLQFLTETGAVGMVIVIWFLAVTYRQASRKLANWPSDTNGAAALAAIAGVTGILVHSFVDFNLQVPANAALFYVLCVIAAMPPRFGLTRRTLRKASVSPEVSPQVGMG